MRSNKLLDTQQAMIQSIITLASVTALLLGSPGPAPLALAATSATFGIKKGIPFLIGILSGLAVAILGSVLGFAVLFSTYPNVKLVFQIAGALYIAYVAIKIATAPIIPTAHEKSSGVPTFLDGFILNLINPKAYAAFLAIFSQFSLPLENVFISYLFTGLVCFSVAVVVDMLWLCLGGLIRPLFTEPRKARLLRIIFSVLMVLAVIWVFLK